MTERSKYNNWSKIVKMELLRQYFVLIVLFTVVTVHADYSSNPDACAFAGLGKKSCYGSGTSSIADLLGYIFRGKTQYFIVGTCEGINFVWGMYYKWQQGAQAIVRLETLYAYILHIPATNCTKETYLVIEVADCPKAFELESCTRGVVSSTDLPWKSVYEVISEYCIIPYPAECEALQGSSSIFTDTSELAFSERLSISVYVDGLTSFLYRKLRCKGNNERPKYVAKEYNLDVEQGVSDPRLYVQKGTPNGPPYLCTDPSTRPPVGRQLAEQNIDIKSVYKPGGLCSLVKRIARIFASTPNTLIFGFVIFSIVQKPYDYAYQFSSLYPRLNDFAVYQSLFGVC